MTNYTSRHALKAYPQSEQGHEGYLITFSCGYRTWIPKKVFEANFVDVAVINQIYDNALERARGTMLDVIEDDT